MWHDPNILLNLLSQTALNPPQLSILDTSGFLSHHQYTISLEVTIMTVLCSPKRKVPNLISVQVCCATLRRNRDGRLCDLIRQWESLVTGVNWQVQAKAFWFPPVFLLAANSCSQSINRSVCRTGGWNRLSSRAPRVPGHRLAWLLLCCLKNPKNLGTGSLLFTLSWCSVRKSVMPPKLFVISPQQCDMLRHHLLFSCRATFSPAVSLH
jgi:hypothetical protein